MQSRRASWLSGKWDKKGLPILELYLQALSTASRQLQAVSISVVCFSNYVMGISLIILEPVCITSLDLNALTRAILISTLPLWNRLFKPLSGPVSARIFQNILKNSPDRGQNWAEGKLYFSEYNFTRDSIALL